MAGDRVHHRGRMDSTAIDGGDRPAAPGDVEAIRNDLQEEQRRYLRLLAEFDNFRRRAAREQLAAADAGRRAALLPLLDVLDALEQALAAGSADASFYQGVAATRQLFLSALRNAGAEPIPTLGKQFDPNIHFAVATVASDNVDPGTIVREERGGWRLGTDLLRPAHVVVAAPAETEPESTSDGT